MKGDRHGNAGVASGDRHDSMGSTPERFISGDCDNVNKIVGKGKGKRRSRAAADRHGITGPLENVNKTARR